VSPFSDVHVIHSLKVARYSPSVHAALEQTDPSRRLAVAQRPVVAPLTPRIDEPPPSQLFILPDTMLPSPDATNSEVPPRTLTLNRGISQFVANHGLIFQTAAPTTSRHVRNVVHSPPTCPELPDFQPVTIDELRKLLASIPRKTFAAGRSVSLSTE